MQPAVVTLRAGEAARGDIGPGGDSNYAVGGDPVIEVHVEGPQVDFDLRLECGLSGQARGRDEYGKE